MAGGRLLSASLAFIAGFVDTAVFVHMGGLFVAHVTGNFVLLGATLTGTEAGGAHAGAAELQLVAFPVFFAAAMLAAGLFARLPAPAGTPTLLWLTAAVMAGTAATVFAGLDADAALSLALVAAMGVLNAAHRLDATLGAPFTVMTGNVTGLAIAAARRLHLSPTPAAPAKAPPRLLPLVLAFALGCAAGAGMQALLGLGAMALPAALLAVCLVARRKPVAAASA